MTREQYPCAPPADPRSEVQGAERRGPRKDFMDKRNAVIADGGAHAAGLAAGGKAIGSGKSNA